MKKSTKKLILGIGGSIFGILTAATGGSMIGVGITGILLRTGIVKASPAITAGALKVITSTGNIVGNLFVGSAVGVSGVALSYESGGLIGDALERRFTEHELRRGLDKAGSNGMTRYEQFLTARDAMKSPIAISVPTPRG